jgi:MFS transporter, DHA1 family, multidrug resistance protein
MVKSAVPVRLSREAQIARASRALILAGFLSNLGFNFVFPLLPLYMRELSGPGAATAIWSGLALAATPLGGAIASPFWGRLADRVGYRPMMLRALISTALLIGLMALPNAPWQLVLLRLLAGALGSFQAVAMGALGAWSRPEDLSRAISRLQMAQLFGAIVGPVAGGFVAAFLGIRFAPVAGACSLAVGTVLVARWLHEPAGRRAVLKGVGVSMKLSYLWLPILTLVAVQFTDASFNPILPLLLAQGTDATATVAGLSGTAASLSATAAAVGSGIAGQLMRKGVRRKIIMAVMLLLVLFALCAVVAPLPWGLVLVRVLCGGLVAGVAVSAYSAGGLAVEPSQRGAAYGWLSSAGMAGNAASPVAAGLLGAIDLRAVLVLDAALCLLSAAGWGFSKGTRVATPPAAAVKRLSAG